jgi:tRNA threonylcarbamoyladenosine biosynthesis protein TsaB
MSTLVLDASSRRVWAGVLGIDGGLWSSGAEGRALPSLFGCIDVCTTEAKVDLADMSRVAVVSGPGSWTGIQAALAAGRSVAFYCGLPLVSLSRLDLMAHQVDAPADTPVAALLDARNTFAYGSTYRRTSSGLVTLVADRLHVGDWLQQIAEMTPACAVVLDAENDVEQAREQLDVAEASFPPPEETLRAALAAVTPLEGPERFDFEPLFLHDPSPRRWLPAR